MGRRTVGVLGSIGYSLLKMGNTLTIRYLHEKGTLNLNHPVLGLGSDGSPVSDGVIPKCDDLSLISLLLSSVGLL